MDMRIARAEKPEEATGILQSMIWDAGASVFRATVHYAARGMRNTTTVLVDPGMEAVALYISKVHGWLGQKEMTMLFDLAGEASGQIVEIGGWQGKSAVCLGWGSKLGNGHPVFSVDPHTGSKEHKSLLKGSIGTYALFKRNIDRAGLADIVRPLKMTSAEAASLFPDESVGLLFIDGDHDQAGADFDLWWPKLMRGAIVLVHDSNKWPKVKDDVESRIINSDDCVYERTVESTAMGRKP